MARDDDHHLDDLNEALPPREVTLSTSAILGLFFALALLCAAFFGFGYSVGRKSVATSAAPDPNAPVADSYKPPAGSPAIQPVPGYMSQQQADAANHSVSENQVYAPPAAAPARAAVVPVSAPAAEAAPARPAATQAVVSSPAPTQTATVSTSSANLINASVSAQPAAPILRAAVPPPPVAATAVSTVNYVQIAAVSRQDDADLLLKALRTHGYAVTAQTGTDRLIHVQMGPFMTRKDADAMRQRLIADGYNAIVK